MSCSVGAFGSPVARRCSQRHPKISKIQKWLGGWGIQKAVERLKHSTPPGPQVSDLRRNTCSKTLDLLQHIPIDREPLGSNHPKQDIRIYGNGLAKSIGCACCIRIGSPVALVGSGRIRSPFLRSETPGPHPHRCIT